jgi:hypothetical protein
MFCRIGFLSVALVLSGGAVAWLVQESRLPAQVAGVKPVIVEEVPSGEILAGSSIPAPPPGRADGIFYLQTMNENEQKILRALSDPRGVEIEFVDTPLKDATDFLADAHGIKIVIDEETLMEEGIAMDEPINRTLSGIKLESALNIILEPMGLAHIVEDEVLKVTTVDFANERRTTRVYHTGYLKQIGVDPESLAKTLKATVHPDDWRHSAMPGGLAKAAQKEAVVSRDDDGGIRVWDVQTTKPLVGFKAKGTHEVQAGGAESPFPMGLNSMEVLGDMLVVSAPQSVHDEIRDVLLQLDRRWAAEHRKQ